MGKQQDFIGFTFDGVHSSDLGILRVSSGSRFSEDLLPSFTDQTLTNPGSEETYYFGTTYTQRVINIDIAYDNMTELQKRKLTQLLGQKKLSKLIFDEHPYKYYLCKPSAAPNLTFVPFGGDGKDRIYKGEGKLTFLVTYPFARSVHKDLDLYVKPDFLSREEWRVASGLLSFSELEPIIIDSTSDTPVKIYNPGDIPAPFNLYFLFNGSTPIPALTISLADHGRLVVGSITKKFGDVGIRINSKTHMIEGFTGTVQNPILSGYLYNEHIISGEFFKIPVTGTGTLMHLSITGPPAAKIEYDYLYY